MQLALIISSANIPAELHAVVSPFTRPSFHFSLSNFPKGRGAEGLGTRLHAAHVHHVKLQRQGYTEQRTTDNEKSPLNTPCSVGLTHARSNKMIVPIPQTHNPHTPA